MTADQAVALGKTEFWKTMSDCDIATFQLNEPRLCMPFGVFRKAIESALNRPVYTHEFSMNHDRLKAELRGEKPAPTMEEIINLIPADKRILVAL
jgi:hypothetical protein